MSDDNDSTTIMAIGNNNVTSSSKEEERVELDVPSRMAPMPPPGKKGGIGKSLSSMIKDEEILLSSIPTPTSR
ncbi:hypothetical protein OAV88_02395 [bacterium]|nr:hypothetical protein [bacterium]